MFPKVVNLHTCKNGQGFPCQPCPTLGGVGSSPIHSRRASVVQHDYTPEVHKMLLLSHQSATCFSTCIYLLSAAKLAKAGASKRGSLHHVVLRSQNCQQAQHLLFYLYLLAEWQVWEQHAEVQVEVHSQPQKLIWVRHSLSTQTAAWEKRMKSYLLCFELLNESINVTKKYRPVSIFFKQTLIVMRVKYFTGY